MAIEIGFISVVVRKEALDALTSSAREVADHLLRWRPEWIREDGHLIATTFMAPSNTRSSCEALQSRTGLVMGRDWTVIDMFKGPCMKADWLQHHGSGGDVMGAWKTGEEVGEMARIPALMPPGRHTVSNAWYRDSLRDTGARKQDFETILPKWGGTSLWLYAENDEPGRHLEAKDLRWVSFDTSRIDFMTW